MDIKELILKKRPSLSKSSITTYSSILRNLYKKVFGDGEIDVKNFDKVKDIFAYLEDIPVNKRKTVLSALFIITDNDKYRGQMLDDISEFNKDIDKQEKTETQKENWVSTDDIMTVMNDMEKEVKILLNKEKFKPSDYQEIQKYIILCLLGGYYIAPRRSKDYVDFKIDNIDRKTDNYLKGNKFYFNSYKTAKTYGQQVIDVPKPLVNLLKKWIAINPTEYLLFDTKGDKLTNVKLNQRLNKIFGSKIGVNAMRHEYLTHKYKDVSDTIDDIEKDFKNMGSSKAQFKTYVKKEK